MGFVNTLIAQNPAVSDVKFAIAETVSEAFSRFPTVIDKGDIVWYNDPVGFFRKEEVTELSYIISLVISIAAGIISHYICKWLDRNNK